MGPFSTGNYWAKDASQPRTFLPTAMKIFIILCIMALATARPGDVSFTNDDGIIPGRDFVANIEGDQNNNAPGSYPTFEDGAKQFDGSRHTEIRPGGNISLSGSGTTNLGGDQTEVGGGGGSGRR